MRLGDQGIRLRNTRPTQRGFTLVAVLLLLALVGLGLAAVGPVWSQQSQREQEQDLMRIGALYAQALASYRNASPGIEKRYPANLEDLVFDKRFVGTMRHMRRLYPDPVNPGQTWGLIRDSGGRITGVYSLSDKPTLVRGTVWVRGQLLPSATRYSEWKFLAEPKT